MSLPLALSRADACVIVYLQLGFITATLSCIPVLLVWWYTEPLLRLVGISADVAALAGTFSRWSLPRMWPHCMYYCFKMFLSAQKIVLLDLVRCLSRPDCRSALCGMPPAFTTATALDWTLRDDGRVDCWAAMSGLNSPLCSLSPFALLSSSAQPFEQHANQWRAA